MFLIMFLNDLSISNRYYNHQVLQPLISIHAVVVHPYVPIQSRVKRSGCHESRARFVSVPVSHSTVSHVPQFPGCILFDAQDTVCPISAHVRVQYAVPSLLIGCGVNPPTLADHEQFPTVKLAYA